MQRSTQVATRRKALQASVNTLARMVLAFAYVLTLAGNASATIDNTATASGTTSPAGALQNFSTSSVSVPVQQAPPSVGLVKTGTWNDVNNNGFADAGDTITYTFYITNTGGHTLTNIAVTDPLLGPVSCAGSTLAPGANLNCAALPYTITQADVDKGQVTNQAKVTAQTPSGVAVSDLSDPAIPGPASDNPTVTVLKGNAVIGLVKQTGVLNDINGNGQPDAGETLTYSFAVTNLGNVTLTNVAVIDPKVSGISCLTSTLVPGQATTCSGNPYVITQADIDAGQAVNQAKAFGTAPSGATVSDLSDPATGGPASNQPTSTPLVQKPVIGLVKPVGVIVDANSNGIIDAGDQIKYTFAVTNLGNVTLSNVAVTDPKVSAITCVATVLAPGQSTSCSGSNYTITAADMIAGKVANQATASATPPLGANVTDLSDPTTQGPAANAPTLTPLAAQPAIGLVKAVGSITDANSNGLIDSGDKINYAFSVSNLGNVDLHAIAVTDPKVASITCPLPILAAGATEVCTGAPYTITLADVNAGNVTNQATVAALAPNNAPVSDASDPVTPGTAANNPTVTSLAPSPAIGIVKAAGSIVDANSNGLADAGDIVSYTFTVSNLGNVTLSGIGVTDPKIANITCGASSLAPGVATLCSGSAYVITQADVDAGQVQNQAKASGTSPTGKIVTSLSDPTTPGAPQPKPTIVTIAQKPLIGLVKAAGAVVDANADGVTDKGDTVAYSFTVTNLGNVTLSNIAVTDPKIAGISCPVSTLAPGTSLVCPAPAYVLTQADIDAGQVSNQAQVTGLPPNGPLVSDQSDPSVPGPAKNAPTIVTLAPTPVIGLVKTAALPLDANGDGTLDAGDTIAYSFTVRNLGNVSLSAISVSDPKVPGISCPAGALAPNTSVACTAAPYVITQADMDAGQASNSATATGTAPSGAKVTDKSDPTTAGPSANAPTLVPLTGKAALSVTKTGTLGGPVVVGTAINYSFTIKNTGADTLTNITLADAAATVSGGPIAALAPGASDTTTFTASHVLTAADITAGFYANTATATATPAPPGSMAVTASGSATTPLNLASSMTLAKTGVLHNGVAVPPKAGDKVDYTLVVTNTGSGPLFNVTVSDPLLAQASAPSVVALLDASEAAPGAGVMTAGFDEAMTTSGIVESANRAAKHLAAMAAPDGQISIARKLVRMPGQTGPIQSGEKIGFLYSIANTGSATITDIQVAQPDAQAYGASVSHLDAGESNSSAVIFTREVTPEEALAGEVTSNAYVMFESTDGHFIQTASEALPLSGIATYDDFATASITPASIPQLDPGKSFSFTAPYTLTQADIDAGTVHNLANATGTDAGGQGQIVSASFDLPLTQAPAVGVVKTGALTFKNGTSAQVGDIITYTFAVTNTGNTTLHNVAVSDAPITIVGAPILSLAPGVTDSTAYTGQYVITQADIDAGSYSNQATATGTAPKGVTVSALSDFAVPAQHRPTVTPVTPAPAIGLLKQVIKIVDTNANGMNDVGDVIQYQFTVFNEGNVTLSNITLVDKVGGGANVVISGGPIASLAPGQKSTAFTGSYVINQADVDLGHVDNTATATGTAPDGSKVAHDSDPLVPTQSHPTIQPLAQKPKVVLYKKMVKWDDMNNDGILDAGDVLHYQFTVQNSGNVTLSNMVLVDALAGTQVTSTAGGVTLAPGTFNNGIFTATYTVTAADAQAGIVHNQATVTANTPSLGVTVNAASVSGDPSSFTPGTTDTPIQGTPNISALLLTPTLVPQINDGIVRAGDTLNYVIKFKNLGPTPINNITAAAFNSPGLVITGLAAGTLAPGQEDVTTFKASYVLTAADIINGYRNSQIKITGSPVISGPPQAPVSNNSDLIDYSQHRMTPYVFASTPQVALTKKFDHYEDATTHAVLPGAITGAVAVYKIAVKNTGNVDFTAVTLAENAGFADTIVPGGPFALAAGASDATHVAQHTITNAEMLSGKLIDQLKATASTAALSPAVTALSDNTSLAAAVPQPTIVPLSAKPALAAVKTYKVTDTNNNGLNDVGDVIVYSFTVANTGNVDLSNVTISDANATLGATTVIPLLPAGKTDTATFTATHTITAGDMAAGSSYSNQASFAATELAAPVLSDNQLLTAASPKPTVTSLQTSLPVLTKTASRSQVKRGDVVPYTITAANTATGVYQIADIMPPGFGYVGGSALVNGVAATPLVNGSVLTFNNLSPVAGKITVTLSLTASATLGGGKFVNNARLIDQSSNSVLAVAQATVDIIPDATFDCSDVIGRVFEDQAGDGYMHDKVKGLANVRVVTVNGIVVTTDAEGRFHVPCAAIPEPAIGSNFIMKVDPHSLPGGYRITTENPRIVRLTRGKATEINFGAGKTHDVKLDITGRAFGEGSAELNDAWRSALDRMVSILRKQRSDLTIAYHQAGESGELAQARVDTVQALITKAWMQGKAPYTLNIVTNVQEGK